MNTYIQHIDNFVFTNDIYAADCIVVNKNWFPAAFIDHYVIYLGEGDDGEHYFIANMAKRGVRLLTEQEVLTLMQKWNLKPSRIRSFEGTEVQRQEAIARALKLLDKKEYTYLLNNCEHFANYVQKGKAFSQQTAIGSGLLTAVGVGMITSKNKTVRNVGIAATAAGLATFLINAFNDER